MAVGGSAYEPQNYGFEPTVGENFSFFSRFQRAPGRSTESIQMKSSMTFIQGNRCIERMIIWKKNGSGTSSHVSFIINRASIMVPFTFHFRWERRQRWCLHVFVSLPHAFCSISGEKEWWCLHVFVSLPHVFVSFQVRKTSVMVPSCICFITSRICFISGQKDFSDGAFIYLFHYLTYLFHFRRERLQWWCLHNIFHYLAYFIQFQVRKTSVMVPSWICLITSRILFNFRWERLQWWCLTSRRITLLPVRIHVTAKTTIVLQGQAWALAILCENDNLYCRWPPPG